MLDVRMTKGMHKPAGGLRFSAGGKSLTARNLVVKLGKRSTLSGLNLVRSKRERMFSITSMVMPGPFGGHCQTSWPLYIVPIGDVVSVECAAKSSSV